MRNISIIVIVTANFVLIQQLLFYYLISSLSDLCPNVFSYNFHLSVLIKVWFMLKDLINCILTTIIILENNSNSFALQQLVQHYL